MCHPRLGIRHDTMLCNIHKNIGNIGRNHILPPLKKCPGFRHAHTGNRSPRADTKFNVITVSRLVHQVCNVRINAVMNIHILHLRLHVHQLLCLQNCPQLTKSRSSTFAFCNGNLTLQIRIAHAHADHKTIQLGLRQKLRSGASFRILCCHNNKRLRHLTADTIHGYLAFLHNFEQSRLCLWRSPVDLICQKQITHNCSRIIHKFSCILLIHIKSKNVCRHDIRRELYSVIFQAHDLGKSDCQSCLTDTRHILY